MTFSKLKNRLYYGWVVALVFCITGIIFWGVRFSFGVFFKSLEAEFKLTRTETSAIFSAQLVLGSLVTIAAGWALDRYGPKLLSLLMGTFTVLSLLLTGQATALWQIFLTYSVLLSLGTSPVYVILTSTLSRWFERRRGLALGIGGVGAGLGTVVMAPLATFLISNFDWRMAYTALGLLAIVLVIPLSLLLKRDPYQLGLLPDGRRVADDNAAGVIDVQRLTAGLSLGEAWRTRSFWLVGFIWVFQALTLLLLMGHFVPHLTDVGFSAGQAAAIFGTLGFTAAIGRVGLGLISDKAGSKLTAVLCAMAQALAMLWLITAQEAWAFYLFAVIFGMAYGGSAPSASSLTSRAFGLSKLGAILGVLDVGFGVGAALGPALGGYIFDVSRSYTLAFLIAGASMLLASLLIFLIRPELGRQSARRPA